MALIYSGRYTSSQTASLYCLVSIHTERFHYHAVSRIAGHGRILTPLLASGSFLVSWQSYRRRNPTNDGRTIPQLGSQFSSVSRTPFERRCPSISFV